MATCNCGRDTYKGGWAEPGNYCPQCGDKKLPGGGVESREELVRKAEAYDRLGTAYHEMGTVKGDDATDLSTLAEALPEEA